VGGNRAHIQSSKQISDVCGAQNPGRAAASAFVQRHCGWGKMASPDIKDLSAVKLGLITESETGNSQEMS
jgi:hypothetical protein